MNMRIGHGFDVHRFAPDTGPVGAKSSNDEFITIGGVHIPSDQPLLAHSDGDVLIHALCDALLGAVGEGDIGQHFPDTDDQYKDVDSRVLLRHCQALLTKQGWALANADITLVAERPKFLPHKDNMITNLANDLGCQPAQVNIKATTTEGLGYTGRKEGIACHAVVLLTRPNTQA